MEWLVIVSSTALDIYPGLALCIKWVDSPFIAGILLFIGSNLVPSSVWLGTNLITRLFFKKKKKDKQVKKIVHLIRKFGFSGVIISIAQPIPGTMLATIVVSKSMGINYWFPGILIGNLIKVTYLITGAYSVF